MPRARPASSPISYHRHSGQYYITRNRKRIYLGADQKQALTKYYLLAMGAAGPPPPRDLTAERTLTAKELASRFLLAQQANWRNPEVTMVCYKGWLRRFLEDHPGLIAADLTVERFAAWKLSMRSREYSPETINHCLSAVRAMYTFAIDSQLLSAGPRLKRVRNESCPKVGSRQKPLYSTDQIQRLLNRADLQVRGMILLALNCGFGCKDVRDLTWNDIREGRVTLPRSKTEVCQTYALWPETAQTLTAIKEARNAAGQRPARRHPGIADTDSVFLTPLGRLWSKNAGCRAFQKLCAKCEVPCYGFYRLRHCASTAISLVTNPHVHRKFMRHNQIQTQVGYTHTPDAEVDAAVMAVRRKLLGASTQAPERDPEQRGGEQPVATAEPQACPDG